MATYTNKGAAHVTKEGKTVANGETFVDSDTDLCVKFPGKFEKATDARPAGPAKASGPVDVTKDFPDAEAADLTVEKRDGKWYIFDDGEAVNEEGLKKKDVNAEIAEYLDGDEE